MYKYNKKNNNKAYSLIEMALVLMLAGLILAGITASYNNYVKQRRTRVTNESLKKINDVLELFYEAQGRYPCPADPTIAPGDGLEKCDSDVFKVVGGMDTEYLGSGEGDPVYVGSIPYETLRVGSEDSNANDVFMESDPDLYKASVDVLQYKETIDDWGRLITYMVPEALTTKATFKTRYASIRVVTEVWTDDATTPNEILSRPAAAWVVFSHGNNGAGGYISDGGTISPIPCEGKEEDNCDALADDPGLLEEDQATIVSAVKTIKKDATYFDDIVYFSSVKNAGFWNEALSAPSNFGSFAYRDVFNSNKGFVGIGISEPSQKLDVSGIVRATKIEASEVCTTDGLECFDVANFALGLKCPSGQVMKGIMGGVVQCVVPIPAINAVPVAASLPCAVGEYALGINSAGVILCGVP